MTSKMHVSLARLNKAMTEDMEVVNELHVYTVKGTSGTSYTVKTSSDNGGEGTCTCPDFTHRQVLCKHLLHCTTVQKERKWCPYGSECSRTNLFHKTEYLHVMKD